MKTRTSSLLALGGLLLTLAAVVGLSVVLAGSPVAAAPGSLPALQAVGSGITISNLPASTCTLISTTRTCELWSMTGTVTMPTGASVPIWGFADSALGPAQLPGPMLIANAGETLKVVLHNQLPGETVSLAFPGQLYLLPDLDGVGLGGTVTYTFPVSNPGTFLYEAGLTDNGARQVAMGLYGGLVVRPVTLTQAYDDPATAYNDEVLLVLSEIDPLFNTDPYSFTMTEYAPRYWLINGKAYPETAEIETTAGNTVLLRYINAGLESHWMGLLGLRQQIIASDGRLRDLPRQVVAETIASGQAVDALVQIPPATVEGAGYALYDTNMLLHNANQRYAPDGPLAFGGMMTFIRTVTGTAAFEAGPAAAVDVSPSPTTGDGGVTLTVRLDDSATGNANVVAAEYFTNSVGAVGTGISLTVGTPAPVVNLTEFIPAGTLAGWPGGYPTFYVRGQDANGNWGFVGSAVLNLDKLGPHSTGISLSPHPTNGQYTVTMRATGDDRSTGRNNVVAATYSVDGGAAQPLSLSRIDSPIVAMTATLPSSPTLMGMPEGPHPIAITAQDSLGNWGVPTIITLTLDRTGPEAPVVTLTPDYLDLSGPPQVTQVRLDALLTDTLSSGVQTTMADSEAFIDEAGPDGTGFALFPSDGLFDEITEAAYFDIPIANFLYLSQGMHSVLVHGLDAAGNWGPLGTASLMIDRNAVDTVGPVVNNLNITPNPVVPLLAAPQAANEELLVTLTASATDPSFLSNIAAGEWFRGADPGVGLGTPLEAEDGVFGSTSESVVAVIDVGTWPGGTYRIYARCQDSSGNWGEVVFVDLVVTSRYRVLLPVIQRN